MGYKKGYLKTGNMSCPEHNDDNRWCEDYEHVHSVRDNECYLPHECGEWVVGDINEATALRDDLNAIIAKWQENVTSK